MSDLLSLQPFDEHNRTLASHVHPADWVNPEPAQVYNLVVIGAGTAGLVTSAAAAGLGAKVALIERELMGGDCLNVGCVPSKGVIAAARATAWVRDAGQWGVHVADWQVDFAAVMERMRRLRAQISPHDAAARFRDLGVDVFLGSGEFVDRHTVEVAGKRLKFKKAVVATGARAARPSIPGIDEVGYLTNESVFSLTELPRRLVVIGGGPIGAELAQSFARFGAHVTQFEQSDRILARDDADAALLVQRAMVRDGVDFKLRAKVVRCEKRGNEKVVIFEQAGKMAEVAGDEILMGIGRTPNVDGLGLDRVGVQYDPRHGVQVDDRLRTTNQRIFAAGDVASRYKFTHAADFMARIVVQNALFMGRAKASSLLIPWCTYTSPEVAHVGLLSRQAADQGLAIDTFTQPMSGVDRAILEGEEEGFVRVHVTKGTDKIVGATVVASNAGDLIGELTLAMRNRLGLKQIGATIHPYPTHAEAIRKLGDHYSRTRLTPTVKLLLNQWLRWGRR